MEDVQYDSKASLGFRSQTGMDPNYPLSFDVQVQQGDRFRKDFETLGVSLREIERSLRDPHSGTAECKACATKKRRIRDAYHVYYLDTTPDRWDAHLRGYREELQSMFDDPQNCSLTDINKRFAQEVRQHILKDIEASSEGNRGILDLVTALNKEEIAPLDAIEAYIAIREESQPLDTQDFSKALRDTPTAQDRISLYTNYYCAPTPDEDFKVKNIKSKYARLFESGMPHDQVLSRWKSEALDCQKKDILELKNQLNTLQMAKNALLRGQKEKAEKAQRMLDREYNTASKQVARCSLQSCGKEIDLSAEEGVVECAVCDWLANKNGRDRGHAYYCSVEHAKQDFEGHDVSQHSCKMDNQCIHFPEPGPEELGSGGICYDCLGAGQTCYFCSQECYKANLEYHRESFHESRGIDSHSERLNLFRPDTDLEIIPI